MIPVRQSTAFETAIGPVLDADGVAVTDCVVGDFKIKKTSGNFAALNGSATLTHVSAGMYDIVLTTSDVDTVGTNVVAIDDGVNACIPVYLQVMEEAVYDALYAASATGKLPATLSSADVSGNLPANAIQIGGQNVGLSSDNRLRVDVAEWNDIPLATTNPLPNVAPAANGGLPTVNASNYIAGMQGTINTLDALDTAQDSQHSTTQGRLPAALTGDGNMKVDVLKIEGADPTDTIRDSVVNDATRIDASAMNTLSSHDPGENIMGATDTVVLTDGSLTNAKLAADTGLKPIRSNTAQGGSANAITLDASASSITDFYNNAWVYITSGTGSGQPPRLITGYNGTTKIATTIPSWSTNPDNSSTFAILPAAWISDVYSLEGFFDNYVGAGGAALNDLGGMSTTMKAQIQTEAEDALKAYNLDHLCGDATGIPSLPAGTFLADRTLAAADYATATNLATLTTTVGASGAGLTDLGGMSTTMKGQVNAEVLDVLNVDTFAEPGQEAPAATNTIRKMLHFLFKAWRNKSTETATTYSLYADDGTTVDQKSTNSDDGTTFTSGEVGSGP